MNHKYVVTIPIVVEKRRTDIESTSVRTPIDLEIEVSGIDDPDQAADVVQQVLQALVNIGTGE